VGRLTLNYSDSATACRAAILGGCWASTLNWLDGSVLSAVFGRHVNGHAQAFAWFEMGYAFLGDIDTLA
jgi:hypothetical protein